MANRKCKAYAAQGETGVSQAEVQPWHRLGGVEHICELRKNATVLYSILVTILRAMYSDRKGRTFGCPDVVWKTDPKKTQLWIDTELRWEDARPDFTPAIFVCLGEIQYDVIPTLDMHGRMAFHHDGVWHYERTGKCSATILHVCDKAGEACALADNTENYLSSLQDQIAEEYCFDNFTVLGRAPLRKKDQGQTAGKDKMVSSVSLSMQFVDSWHVKIESPILKVVSIMERGDQDLLDVAGDVIVKPGAPVEIEFGDLSTETDTPKDV